MILKMFHLPQFRNFHPLTPIMEHEPKMIINLSTNKIVTSLKTMNKLLIHQLDTALEK